MELHIDETVEPSVSERFTPSAPRRRASFSDVFGQLEHCRIGRAVLGVTRWSIVAALIVAGYYSAAAINFSIDCATRDSSPSPQMIVASAPR